MSETAEPLEAFQPRRDPPCQVARQLHELLLELSLGVFIMTLYSHILILVFVHEHIIA